MNNPKTAEGLRKLIAVSFIMQNMSDSAQDIANSAILKAMKK